MVFLLIAACGRCGDDEGPANEEDFSDPVGEWTPESCETKEDEDGDGFAGCLDPDCAADPRCAFEPGEVDPPPLPLNGVASFWERTSWTFAEGGIQRGVTDGVISEHNIGTVRGRVLDHNGLPLVAAAVTIAGSPELGRTYTRHDGTYDLAFDVGRRLVLRVAADGHVTSDRTIHPRLQRATSLEDIRLVPVEAESTLVDFSRTILVEGTTAEDADGVRRTAVLFPDGTKARMEFPNGARRPLDEMHVRATEVTVGEDGPSAMMAELPPGTLYTYAAEFTVDEAVEANAESVVFDRPVFIHVDNFLDFPTGSAVPSGFYDRSDLAWEGMPDGVILEVLSVTGGRATLADGDGSIDAAGLAFLGIGADELRIIAQRYEPGDSFWRVPTRHFTPFDLNWGGPFPPGTTPPPAPGPEHPPQCTSGQERGSLIGCSSQTLAEQIRLSGTPFTLVYQSGRVPGRKPVITVPMYSRGAEQIIGARVRVTAAGQIIADETFRELGTVPRAIDFTWDGQDQFGRDVQGAAEVEVEVALVYKPSYEIAKVDATNHVTGEIRLESSFGDIPRGEGVSVSMRGAGWTLRRRYTRTLTVGTYDVVREGLGGWTVDLQHRYDPRGRVMYYGNGQDLPAGDDGGVLRVVVGGADFDGQVVRPEDGAAGVEVQVAGGRNRAPIGNDGTIYFYDLSNTVRAIDPATDELRTVAGRVPKFDGSDSFDVSPRDGANATDTTFPGIKTIRMGKDHRLYIQTMDFIYRLTADGRLQLMVGADETPLAPGAFANGTPANEVSGRVWDDFDVSADGTVYLHNGRVIYKRTPDGRMREVAGSLEEFCDALPCGEDGFAATTPFGQIEAFAVSADGDVYIAEESRLDDVDREARIRKIRRDGILQTLGEVPRTAFMEIGPADQVYLSPDVGNLFGPDDEKAAVLGAAVVELLEGGELIPRVGMFENPETPSEDLFGFLARPVADGDFANRPLPAGNAFSVSPAGQFVFNVPGRVFRLETILPGRSGSNYQIARPHGAVVDEFTPDGRHLRAVETLTGATLWTFEYDDEGRLATARDGSGNETKVVRDSANRPLRVEGPDGIAWSMEVDTDGMLVRLTSPMGDLWSFEYSDGLMTTFNNPRQETWEFTYDEAGRLVEDRQPNGGASNLKRDAELNAVVFTTAEGRMTTYGSTPYGQQQRSSSITTGELSQVSIQRRGGWVRTLLHDDTESWRRSEPHPLFGLIASYDAESWLETPAGLRLGGTTRQEVAAAGTDLFGGLDKWEVTQTTGSAAIHYSWDPTSRSLTTTSGENREVVTTLDEQSRPTEIAAAGFTPAEIAYDARGRLAEVSRGDRSVSVVYGANGYLAAIVGDDGTTSFTRDAMGRIAEAIRADAAVMSLDWDAVGDLTSVSVPGVTQAYEMTHDARGNLLTQRTPLGLESSFSFDLDYRLVEFTDAVGRVSRISYDESNRVTGVEVDGEPTELVYGQDGRLAEANGGDVSIAVTNDGPLVTAIRFSGVASGQIDYEWDDGTLNLGRTNLNGETIEYRYDSDGFPTLVGAQSIEYEGGTILASERTVQNASTQYAYNDFGELSGSVGTVDGTQFLDRQLNYDSLGRIVEVVETTQAGSTTIAYRYDLAGRLVRAEARGTTSYLNTYEYDENGNRTAVVNAFDSLGTTEIETDADDRLLTYGEIAFVYNDAGQLSERSGPGGTTTYAYAMMGELDRVTLPDGRVVRYERDALRRRVGRSVDGVHTHRFLYAGNVNPVAEVDESGATVSTFVYGTGLNVPDYMLRGTTTYYFVRDHLGSVRFVVDANSGTVAQELRYDEFGNVLEDSNPGFQPFGFAGGLYDPDTGLVRFGARDYDPRVGRWTAPDPLGFGGQQSNWYVYSRNSPATFLDPVGAAPIFFAVLVPAAIGAAANAFVHRDKSGREFKRAAVNGALGGAASGAVAVVATAGLGVAIGAGLGTGIGGGVTKYMNLIDCLEPVQNSIAQDVGYTAGVYLVAGLVAGLFSAGAIGGVELALARTSPGSFTAAEVAVIAATETASAFWATQGLDFLGIQDHVHLTASPPR